MKSLIPGYEYDIFISYRQKDNKGGRWVSEFVEALKTELESTFKEEISVYFDINPHDGLLETYDVDASLKEKLKCLVFIPVISRTYCDTKSFAWEHEFKAFVEQATQDQFGLKVKLPNGNIASRVLPIRIYDLDNADIKLCESLLGGALRGVEFIYTEPGVNRPLRQRDDDATHITKQIIYRDQINKVANAINEIISGLRAEANLAEKEKSHHIEQLQEVKKADRKGLQEKPARISGRKMLINSIGLFVLLVIATIFAYPKIFKRNTLEKLRSGEGISVAVMPFRNVTNDSTLNIWQDGIQFNLITSLSNSTDLKVRQTESTNNLLQSKGFADYALITPSVAKTISLNLDANIFIYGTINEADKKIRISAQLIDSKTDVVFKSFQLNGEISKILVITDSLSSLIKNFLVISDLKGEISPEFQMDLPNSVEAYKSFILGYKAFLRNDNLSASRLFSEALKIDSGFISSYIWLALSDANLDLYDQAKKWSLKAYEKKDQLSFDQRIWTSWLHARYVEKSGNEELKYAKQLLEIGNDDRVPLTHFVVGSAYSELQQYNNAIPEFGKALEIYKDWNTKPPNSPFYEELIIAYYKTGRYKEAKELLKKAIEDFPNSPQITSIQAIQSLSEGDSVTARRYIEKWKSIRMENSWTEANIADGIASIYDEAGSYKKAEDYYRQALSLEPQSPERLNDLGWFLIDKGRNINEGLEIVDRALKLNPDDYNSLDSKGWGLYKQGHYKDALEILQKSWDLRMKNGVYNNLAFNHLEEAKKAITAQKNN